MQAIGIKFQCYILSLGVKQRICYPNAHMSHTVHTYTPDLMVQSLPPSVSMLVIEQPPPLDWETLEAKSPDQHWVPVPHTE